MSQISLTANSRQTRDPKGGRRAGTRRPTDQAFLDHYFKRLDPEVVVWEISRPVIEEWIRENLGPQARVRETFSQAAGLVRRLPALMEKAETVVEQLSGDGLKLDPESAKLFTTEHRRTRPSDRTLIILGVLALIAIALLT